MTNTIAEALVDVRKAHRLIYTFNRRVFEMAKIIGDALPGFEFKLLKPYYDLDFASKWKPGDAVESYWNSTPFVNTEMVWSKLVTQGAASIGDQLFGLVVSVDTEWYENDNDIDPSTYRTGAENSKTEIIFYLLTFEKEMTMAQKLKVWENFEADQDMVITRVKGGQALGVMKTTDMADIEYLEDSSDLVNKFMTSAKTMILSSQKS